MNVDVDEEIQCRPRHLTLAAVDVENAYKTHLQNESDLNAVPDELGLPSSFVLQVRKCFMEMAAHHVGPATRSVIHVTELLETYVQILMKAANVSKVKLARQMVASAYVTLEDKSPETLYKFNEDVKKYYNDIGDEDVCNVVMTPAFAREHIQGVQDCDGIQSRNSSVPLLGFVRDLFLQVFHFRPVAPNSDLDIVLDASARVFKRRTARVEQNIATLAKKHQRARKLCRTANLLHSAWEQYAVAMNNFIQVSTIKFDKRALDDLEESAHVILRVMTSKEHAERLPVDSLDTPEVTFVLTKAVRLDRTQL